MKQRPYHIAIILWIFANAWGCSPEPVLIQVNPAETRLVISSQFIPDSLLVVTVSKSFSALSGKSIENLENNFIETLLVDRARVLIHTNGQTHELNGTVPGLYVGTIGNTEPFQTFELEVYDSATNLSVTSVTQLMPQVRFDSLSLSHKIDDGDTVDLIYYEFTDPIEENWYLIQAFEVDFESLLDNLGFGNEEDTFDIEDSFIFNRGKSLLFSNLISDLTIKNNLYADEERLFENVSDTIVMVMMNIEQDYYDFLQARKRTGNIITAATSEPINHPSNIDGGYGYFTLHEPTIKVVIRKN